MKKNLIYMVLASTILTLIFSCEKDFTNFENINIIENDKFQIKDTVFEIATEQINIESVQTDNISSTINNYILGFYNNSQYKSIKASITSQVTLSTSDLVIEQNSVNDIENYKTEENIDTLYTLNSVDLTLPLAEQTSDSGIDLDKVLNHENKTIINVFENITFLNKLNPTQPSKNNQYNSDDSFNKGDLLSETNGYSFNLTENDTVVTIPLDVTIMKEKFWNKFRNDEFTSKEKFNDYFKGIIIEPQGEDGALIPIDFNSDKATAAINFNYAVKFKENGVLKDTIIEKKYIFNLSGIRIGAYDMNPKIQKKTDKVNHIQGTAGSMASIEIFTQDQVEKLREKDWLINEASLYFYIDQETNKDSLTVPNQLLLYKKNNSNQDVFLSDIYKESVSYDGNLVIENNLPAYYKIGITNYVSDLIKSKQDLNILYLKSRNSETDKPSIENNILVDSLVKNYNWSPKGVTLLNEDKNNAEKRAVLKLSYSKK